MRKRLVIFLVAFLAGILSVHRHISALQNTEPLKEEKQGLPIQQSNKSDEKNQSNKDENIVGIPTAKPTNRPVAVEGTITVMGKLGVKSHYSKNDEQNRRVAKTCALCMSSRQLAPEREMIEEKTVPI